MQEKQRHFQIWRDQGLKLTFDDVRLESASSSVSAGEVDITSRFSRNVGLKTPFVSAAMDTVTTSKMAIAMAQLGGLGIIHAALSPEQQRREVRKVKLFLNGLIERPIVFQTKDSIQEVFNSCLKNGFEFRNFPILNENGKIAGILTQEALKFAVNTEVALESVMVPIQNIKVCHKNTSIDQAYKIMLQEKQSLLPLISKKGNLKGMYLWSDVKRIVNDKSGLYNVDEKGRLRVGAAVSTSPDALEVVKGLQKYLDVVVIDTAQGDSKFAFQTLKTLKEANLDLDVVVGNVSSAKSAGQLALQGADGIKVGQGPGSICTTRIETGIGSPQVSAVFECARKIKKQGLDVPVCADGGIKDHGDLSIALAAGAQSVMMGSMLAGTSETPGEQIWLDGKPHKRYRGMGSAGALRDNLASRKRYGGDENTIPLPEGVEAVVPYKGSVTTVITPCVQSLKKSMSYVGATNIKEHNDNTVIFRITNSGMKESHSHDVKVI